METEPANKKTTTVNKKDNKIIHSLDKGLLILEMLAQAQSTLSLNDFYLRLGWERATIHRLLETLSRRGYVFRHPETKRYSLGLRIFSLYLSLQTDFNIQAVARPILRQLVDEFGESAHVAVPMDTHMLVVDFVDTESPVSVTTKIGDKAPLHCTAIGKCLLAFDQRISLESRFPHGLEPKTDKSITDLETLSDDLGKIRKHGFALDDEECRMDVRCAAAPVFNDQGMVIAAIGISAPKFRMPLNRLSEIGEQLITFTTKISSAMG